MRTSRRCRGAAEVAGRQFRGAVDFDVGVHPDLHARFVAIGGGMNWWQAILTIFLGNVIVLIPMVLNAHAGTTLWNSVSGLLPRVVWDARRECAGADARVRRLRLVRHSDVDRRQCDLQNPRRSFIPSSTPAASRCLGIKLAAVRLLPFLLGHQHAGHLQRHRFASAGC